MELDAISSSELAKTVRDRDLYEQYALSIGVVSLQE